MGIIFSADAPLHMLILHGPIGRIVPYTVFPYTEFRVLLFWTINNHLYFLRNRDQHSVWCELGCAVPVLTWPQPQKCCLYIFAESIHMFSLEIVIGTAVGVSWGVPCQWMSDHSHNNVVFYIFVESCNVYFLLRNCDRHSLWCKLGCAVPVAAPPQSQNCIVFTFFWFMPRVFTLEIMIGTAFGVSWGVLCQWLPDHSHKNVLFLHFSDSWHMFLL